MFPAIILEVYYMKNQELGKKWKYNGKKKKKIMYRSGLDPGTSAWESNVYTTRPSGLSHDYMDF